MEGSESVSAGQAVAARRGDPAITDADLFMTCPRCGEHRSLADLRVLAGRLKTVYICPGDRTQVLTVARQGDGYSIRAPFELEIRAPRGDSA